MDIRIDLPGLPRLERYEVGDVRVKRGLESLGVRVCVFGMAQAQWDALDVPVDDGRTCSATKTLECEDGSVVFFEPYDPYPTEDVDELVGLLEEQVSELKRARERGYGNAVDGAVEEVAYLVAALRDRRGA